MQLTTTQIGAHFGVTMSTEFILNTLRVPSDGTLKRATLWEESKLYDIASALAAHAEARGRAAVSETEKTVKTTKSKGAADDLF